ncbi:hypothetical protein ES704_03496 [subsurface metagenome]|jgi:uncharacterized membrane protein YfcA
MNFRFWTRRIIAFIFAGCGAGVLSYLAIQGNREALVALVAIVSSVTSFYFGSKFGSEKPET